MYRILLGLLLLMSTATGCSGSSARQPIHTELIIRDSELTDRYVIDDIAMNRMRVLDVMRVRAMEGTLADISVRDQNKRATDVDTELVNQLHKLALEYDIPFEYEVVTSDISDGDIGRSP